MNELYELVFTEGDLLSTMVKLAILFIVLDVIICVASLIGDSKS